MGVTACVLLQHVAYSNCQAPSKTLRVFQRPVQGRAAFESPMKVVFHPIGPQAVEPAMSTHKRQAHQRRTLGEAFDYSFGLSTEDDCPAASLIRAMTEGSACTANPSETGRLRSAPGCFGAGLAGSHAMLCLPCQRHRSWAIVCASPRRRTGSRIATMTCKFRPMPATSPSKWINRCSPNLLFGQNTPSVGRTASPSRNQQTCTHV